MDFDYLTISAVAPPALPARAPVDTGEDTFVASAVVTAPPYNADATGGTDTTAAIQAAIDATATWGGGVVFLPEGRYKVEGNLTLKTNVALVGQWRPYGKGGNGTGTILMAYAGRDDPGARHSLRAPACATRPSAT
jgi:hypothetical protein